MSSTIREYLQKGLATSKEIQAATGMSQAVVSRKIRSMGNSVIRIKRGRSPLYSVTRNAFGGIDTLPLAMIDSHGNTVLVAIVRPLAHGGFFIEPATDMPPLLLGENGTGLYDDLPYFLQDLCPQGFLGRKIAADIAARSEYFPPDPRYWSADHIGRYLVSNGDDLPGNFKFGEQALLRVRQKTVAVSDNDYPKLADEVISGELPGSSAGGEQPKFTAFSAHNSSHVIVKFSPKGYNEVASRWRDILLTEYHAIKAIHNKEFPAAETRLIALEDRLFLESNRFDRSGEYGRMSMISLLWVDAEFVGVGSRGWPFALDGLYKMGLVSWQHVYDAEVLWCFGKLINNTDMHLGNLSFAIEGNVFRLLPVYDMCSMGFAPKGGGEVVPYSFEPVYPTQKNISDEALPLIIDMARDFWERLADDERISAELKAFLSKGNPIDLIQGRNA